MKFKGIIIALLLLIVVFIGGKYVIKKFVFPYQYKEFVDKYSEEHNVDPYLVLAVIKAESDFNREAVSKREAKGLMQIMDSTGEWIAEQMGINYFMPHMLFDPEVNIQMGCWYLSSLDKEFKDLNLVLASYNGGRGNVAKWLGDSQYSSDGKHLDYIPFPETKKYVDKVTTYYKVYKYLYQN